MKRIFLFMTAVVAIAMLPGRVMAQSSLTEETEAAANIVTSLTITEDQSLHFGTISQPTSEITVTVTPAQPTDITAAISVTGTRTTSGDESLLSAASPTFHNAAYRVSGEPGQGYNIVLPTSITIESGSNSMDISDLYVYRYTGTATESAASAISSTLDGTSGLDGFTVGGTLTVSANQATGLYTANFDVEIAYE